MYDLFVHLLNQSLAAGVLILVILLLRLLLKKAPKRFSCILWALVALRLILPFGIPSEFSAYNLIRSPAEEEKQIVSFQYNGKPEKPLLEMTVPALANDNLSSDSVTFGEDVSDLYFPPVLVLWLAGAGCMLLYAAVSSLQLRKKVAASIPLRDKIRVSDDVPAPFILGIVRPVIYVPSGMEDGALQHVIAHESAHIRHRDHWWKPLGYLLLSFHWFNPLCWLAYFLFCRDTELACDERAIRQLDAAGIAAYAQALLDCGVPQKKISFCPVAFGEVGVKARVKSVLHYKKPAFWIVLLAVILCAAVAVCFLTGPKTEPVTDPAGEYVCEEEGFGGDFVLTLDSDGTFQYCEGLFSSYIGMGLWTFDGETVTLFDHGSAEERVIRLTVDGSALLFDREHSVPFIYVDLDDGVRFIRSAPVEKTEEVSYDRIPSVMVDGTLYLDMGRKSDSGGDPDGEITSECSGSQLPTQNDQSNFGTGFPYRFGPREGTVEVQVNGEWYLYAAEAVRRELQFPQQTTVYEPVDTLRTNGTTLPQDEADAITDAMLHSEQLHGWEDDVTRSAPSCVLSIGGQMYNYSSFDGIFNDTANTRSLRLTQEDADTVNEILALYVLIAVE